MQLNPGMAAEYQKRHDQIWPELITVLKQAGIKDYSIHFEPKPIGYSRFCGAKTIIKWQIYPPTLLSKNGGLLWQILWKSPQTTNPKLLNLSLFFIWNKGIMRNIGVIDIGKTHIKVTVIDVKDWQEVASLKQQNIALDEPPYPHFDSENHWQFILDSLSQLNQRIQIDVITTTTHGASIVLLQKDGTLAAPIMDYEFSALDDTAVAYDEIRPDFTLTGSPRLKLGLNVGAQIFWQFHQDPSLLGKVDKVLTYPQYWTYRLTGIAATEVTSLGCHTDLWEPREHRYTNLVKTLGISDKMSPLRRAMDGMGQFCHHWQNALGLAPMSIFCVGSMIPMRHFTRICLPARPHFPLYPPARG